MASIRFYDEKFQHSVTRTEKRTEIIVWPVYISSAQPIWPIWGKINQMALTTSP